MNKNQLRNKYRDLRETLSSEEVEKRSLKIANQLLELPVWELSFYHIFLSIKEKKEVDTEAILHVLQGKDKNVVLSKADFKTGSLTNYLLTDNTKINVNSWGIPEPEGGIEIKPEQIEVVFVPLLAFDQKGSRVGYGKGFYDRFLSHCSIDVIKIGLSLFEVEEEISDVTKNDVPLDYCVTPEKIYNFKNL
ncbi:5-formyltetrahydrofolate cyclo-ligase [Salinimicrobium flavum]|uniref:5-formyltetrahydrofolate cyclo-ligase n=1 Tax=Salinimicrobium flavum TaxID=1737065 RepID=A0ABW5IUX1_9FLAO